MSGPEPVPEFRIERPYGDRFRVLHADDLTGRYTAECDTREAAQAFLDQIPPAPSRCVYCSVHTWHPVMGMLAAFGNQGEPTINRGRLCAHCAYEFPGLIITSSWEEGR